MNASASLMKDIMVALGVASMLVIVAVAVAVRLLRRKLVG
jgi:hypothetical protein